MDPISADTDGLISNFSIASTCPLQPKYCRLQVVPWKEGLDRANSFFNGPLLSKVASKKGSHSRRSTTRLNSNSHQSGKAVGFCWAATWRWRNIGDRHRYRRVHIDPVDSGTDMEWHRRCNQHNRTQASVPPNSQTFPISKLCQRVASDR